MAKKKQEVKLKEPVRIRFKQLANGNQSIYLDYYTGDVIRKENYVGGKRQYEFLKLYLRVQLLHPFTKFVILYIHNCFIFRIIHSFLSID
jgi:hypothetical protein